MPTKLSKNNRIFIILFGFITVMLLMAVAVVISKKLLEQNVKRVESIVNENIAKQALLSEMSTSIRTRMLYVYDMLHSDDPFEIDERIQQYFEQGSVFIASREKIINLGLSDEQSDKIEFQKSLLTTAREILDKTVEEIVNQEKSITLDDIKLAREVNQIVITDLKELYEQQTKIANQQLSGTKEANNQSTIRVSWLIAIAILLSIATIIFIILHINRQDKLLQNALFELEQHNLNLSHIVEIKTEELLKTRQENIRMSAEIEVNQRIQEIMLPSEKELKQVENLDIAIFMQPADEVGGDYIDILPYADNRILLSIGDVTGHGLESGLVMIMVQSMVRHQSNIDLENLADVISRLNTSLYQNIERMKNGKNLTLCLLDYQKCELDNGTAQGEFRICGQHESLLIIRNKNTIETIETFDLGFPVGLIDNIQEYCNEAKITINKGETLILYTDGITEAANANDELYGMKRLEQSCINAAGKTAHDIRDNIIADVKSFMGNTTLYDDLSLIVVNQN